MKNIITIALILILPLFAYWALDSSKNKTIIPEALAGDKPSVIIFSSAMCGECVKMKKIIESVEPNYDNKVEFIKLNAQSNDAKVQNLVKKYKIQLVPTMVFIDKSGNPVKQKEGAMSKDAFENEVKGLING